MPIIGNCLQILELQCGALNNLIGHIIIEVIQISSIFARKD